MCHQESIGSILVGQHGSIGSILVSQQGSIAGVEIAGVRQSEDCQKFGRTAEVGVSGSPTDTRQILEYYF